MIVGSPAMGLEGGGAEGGVVDCNGTSLKNSAGNGRELAAEEKREYKEERTKEKPE